jgi:error-prone DNA polymerase
MWGRAKGLQIVLHAEAVVANEEGAAPAIYGACGDDMSPARAIRVHARGFVPCAAMRTAPNGRRISIAGLVLVRQMPGSAKGVMFITLEDEQMNSNLIVRPSIFEQNRPAILGATFLGCRGKVQSANGVVHLIVEHVIELSADLKRVSGLNAAFPRVSGWGDEAKTGGSRGDSREPEKPITKPRNMYVPNLHIDTLKVKTRSFR